MEGSIFDSFKPAKLESLSTTAPKNDVGRRTS